LDAFLFHPFLFLLLHQVTTIFMVDIDFLLGYLFLAHLVALIESLLIASPIAWLGTLR
jgi:hypothetical protein